MDSSVFSRVARQHGICLFTFDSSSAATTAKPDQETLALFDALDPLYTTALRSFGSKLPELDGLGLGRGLDAKWTICGVRKYRHSVFHPNSLHPTSKQAKGSPTR